MGLTTTINADMLQGIKLLDALADHYRVEVRPDEVLDVIDSIDSPMTGYHPFLHEMVETINGLMPFADPPYIGATDKPYVPQKRHTFLWGREYSRVLYVEIAKNYCKRECTQSKWANIIIALKELGKKYQADEFYVVENDELSLSFRFWWD